MLRLVRWFGVIALLIAALLPAATLGGVRHESRAVTYFSYTPLPAPWAGASDPPAPPRPPSLLRTGFARASPEQAR